MTPSGVVLNTLDDIYKYEIPPGFNIMLDIDCLTKNLFVSL